MKKLVQTSAEGMLFEMACGIFCLGMLFGWALTFENMLYSLLLILGCLVLFTYLFYGLYKTSKKNKWKVMT